MTAVERPSRIEKVDPQDPDPDVIAQAGELLASGGLVAFPTETVYGLGANAFDGPAIAAVFAGKGRPPTDPLIVHVLDEGKAQEVVSAWPDAAKLLATAFWPGPLTLVLPKTGLVPDAITAGLDTVAIRVPAHPVARAVLEAAGVPVAAPSANRFGRISPTCAEHVVSELEGSYDLLLDGGPTLVGVESTVVDLSGAMPVLLRPGGVTLESLREIVGPVDHAKRSVQDEQDEAVAPGQFLRHYAPSTPLVLIDGAAVPVEDLVASLSNLDIRCGVIEPAADLVVAAHDLYSDLRGADDSSADLLLVRVVDDDGLGRAINDRLFRAAQGRIVADGSAATAEYLAAFVRG